MKLQYSITAPIWQHSSPMGWHFITLPLDVSQEIRLINQSLEEGWGRLKVTAQIANLSWKTAIWFDTKHQAYLLPIKADIRKKLQLHQQQIITVLIFI